MTTVPLSGTNIRLLTNVPFTPDYSHTRWFNNLNDQTNWFLARQVVYSKNNANFQRPENRLFIKVETSVDDLWNVNYLMFQNTSYGNRWFYAFVTNIEYVQRNTTYVHFSIDVLQTWAFDYTFKPSFVVREHCQLYNDTGSPVINTIDEGLFYGTEYDTVSVTNFVPNNNHQWLVIVTKWSLHDGANNQKVVPTVQGTPSPLTTYLIPFKDDNTTPTIHIDNPGAFGMGDGQISKPTDILKALYSDTQAVNNIVSIYVTDWTGVYCTTTPSTDGTTPDLISFPNNPDSVQLVSVTPTDTSIPKINLIYVEHVDKLVSITEDLGDKYQGYKSVTESKLMMYPYTKLIFDDFNGNRVEFKNEYINFPNIHLLVKGSIGISNKVSYSIPQYNYNDALGNEYQEQVSDQHALVNTDPCDIPVIVDQLSAYLQGNKNSINNQRNSINWNMWMNGASALTSEITAGVEDNKAGLFQSFIGGVQSWGNSQLALQGIMAKQNDIKNTPPSIQKMGSNYSYSQGYNYNGVFIIKQQIKDEYIKKLENYFNMYGYKRNEVKTPNFNTRKSWNYIQTKGAVLTGNMNNDDLQMLMKIFDKGITVWHTDDIGNYTLDNSVVINDA